MMNYEDIKGTKYIKMMPEIDGCCFWNSTGIGCGDYEKVFLEDDSEIDTSSIEGLEKWVNDYDYPMNDKDYWLYWNPSFQLEYATRGLALAMEFRKILPQEYALYLHIPDCGVDYLLVNEEAALEEIFNIKK